MPPELAEVRAWLTKASNDLRTAEIAVGVARPVTDTAAFHCQQAVEKLFKAYLTWRQHEFEKIHDLEELVNACASLDGSFMDLMTDVVPLTPFAVRYRYPGPNDPTVKEVREAIEVVRRVRRFVEDRLPSEVKTDGKD